MTISARFFTWRNPAGADTGVIYSSKAPLEQPAILWTRWAIHCAFVAGFLVATGNIHAHIGSPNVYYDGEAGPYPIRVTIKVPGVVPGLAEIHVRVLAGEPGRVSVLPALWSAGTEGAPPPDKATRVAGQTNLFTCELWLMESGAYSVLVTVEGKHGKGTAAVPLNSLATERRAMPRGLGAVLGGLGVFLFVLMLAIVGAAVRESVLTAGHHPDRKRRWKARLSMGLAAALLTWALVIGRNWWKSVDAEFRNNRLYDPLLAQASVAWEEGKGILHLETDTTQRGWRESTPLVPDHGKIMHLYLIRESGLDAFAHIHPRQMEKMSFEAGLPPLPAGRYRIYADVTHESGLTQTIVASADIPPRRLEPGPGSDWEPGDPDDSWQVLPHSDPDGMAVSIGADGDGLAAFLLDREHVMYWEKPARMEKGKEVVLQFKVTRQEGRAAELESYLGMASHAVVLHRDGSVFAHLHPRGTISMAAQRMFAKRDLGSAAETDADDPFCGRLKDQLTFPYEFPKPGPYRIWVQVKVEGKVRTGVFDAQVAE